MKKLLGYIIINSISLYLVTLIIPGFKIYELKNFIMFSILLGIVNNTLGKLLKLLTLPINFLTFGLFSVFINGFIFKYAIDLSQTASIDSLNSAIIAGIVLSISNKIISSVFK